MICAVSFKEDMGKMMSNNHIGTKMISCESFAVLNTRATLKEALDQMTKFRLGISCLVDESNKLIGVLTDGDLRRLLLTKQSPLPELLVSPAIEFGHKNPITIKKETSVDDAKLLMQQKEIWDLPVIDNEGKLQGLVHRHAIS